MWRGPQDRSGLTFSTMGAAAGCRLDASRMSDVAIRPADILQRHAELGPWSTMSHGRECLFLRQAVTVR